MRLGFLFWKDLKCSHILLPFAPSTYLDHILPVRKKQLNSGFSGLYNNSCHMLSSDNLLNPYHPFRGHGAARTQPGHFWVKTGYTPDRSPVWATAPACSPKKKNKKKNQTSAVILLVLWVISRYILFHVVINPSYSKMQYYCFKAA